MDEQEVLARVSKVVGEVLDLPDITLSMETVANEVDGWDSLRLVEIVISLEEEFGIRFRTGEMAAMDDVGALVRYIQKHLGDA